MKMIQKCLPFLVSLLLFANPGLAEVIDATQSTLVSPDGHYKFRFYQKVLSEGKKQMYYSIDYKGRSIILESHLGVLVENQLFEAALGIEPDPSEFWCEDMSITEVSKRSVDQYWKPLYGERSQINDRYNELIISFEKISDNEDLYAEYAGTSGDKSRFYNMNLIIRAYDEGVAFRYHFPETRSGLFLHLTGEQTAFQLPEGAKGYFSSWAQGPYHYLSLREWAGESDRPLTLVLDEDLYVVLTEAQMVEFSRTKFKVNDNNPNILETSMYDKAVDVMTPFSSPWRVIMAANEPGELLENNDLILNLNPENQIANTTWIKPGKVFRSNLTTHEAKEAVDFAFDRKFQYVHLDAGWYGPEKMMSSDATTVDENRDLELQKIINYAGSKDIGVIVYVNQRALANQLDEILPLYQSWGLKGIKFGFVQVGSNRWTNWMHAAIKKAADHQLLINVHDEYRPTGFSRTYPNLMTQEGIKGNEEMPDATHNTILPFTRYVAGAADYTICYYTNRIKTTRAHQLALSVIYYSPLQYIFWYDTPALYRGEEEIEFFENVKTVWDDTKVLNGRIGQYVTVARRSGHEWFVGTITNNDARDIDISLNFLDPSHKYVAHLYVDDDKVDTNTKVGIKRFLVDSDQTIKLPLKATGGAALHLVAASVEDLKKYKTMPVKVVH